MKYRRSNITGGTYFFTVNLLERKTNLLINNIELLRTAKCKVYVSHPFEIIAMVILPDHIHAVWELPRDDHDFATRWMLIKSYFSRGIPKSERIGESRQLKRERGIWQRRYWEHQIRDEKDLQRHVDYIHYNPVNHGLVTQSSAWPYSTIHRAINQGVINHNWGIEVNGQFFGE